MKIDKTINKTVNKATNKTINKTIIHAREDLRLKTKKTATS